MFDSLRTAKQTESRHPLSSTHLGLRYTYCLWPGLPFYKSSRMQRGPKNTRNTQCNLLSCIFPSFCSRFLCAQIDVSFGTKNLCVTHAIFIEIACYDDHVVRATHRRFGIEIPTAIRVVNQTVRVRYHPRHVDNSHNKSK